MSDNENIPMSPLFHLDFSFFSTFKVSRKQSETRTKTDEVENSLSPVLIPSNPFIVNGIYENAIFLNFDHFERVFKEYQFKTHTKYRISSSMLMKDECDNGLKQQFKYHEVKYVCRHFGIPRVRSKGIRKYCNYLSLGCQSRLRLRFHQDTMDLRIHMFHSEHNHKCADIKRTVVERKLMPKLKRSERSTESIVSVPLMPINDNQAFEDYPMMVPSNSPSSSITDFTESVLTVKKPDIEIVADQMLDMFKQIISPEVDGFTKEKLDKQLGGVIEAMRIKRGDSGFTDEAIKQLEVWQKLCKASRS